MLNENAKKWVKALRSGDYEQQRCALTILGSQGEVKGHCCLGVACELYAAEHSDMLKETDSDCIVYNGNSSTLPDEVREWLDLRTSSGSFDDGYSLAQDNDDGKSFNQIADMIESESEGLFV